MIRKYKNIVPAWAIQFTKDITSKELEIMIEGTRSRYHLWTKGLDHNEGEAEKLMVLDTLFGIDRSVNFLDYIVKFNDGQLTVMTKENFEQRYEELR